MKKHTFLVWISIVTLMLLLVSCGAGGGGGGSDTGGTTDNGETTGDTTRPTVSSTSPSDGATSIAVNSAITVTFSESMDASTLNESTLTLSYSGGSVSGTVTCTGSTATFTPSSNLNYDTVYTSTITTGVKDEADNAIGSSYSWSFTTEAQPTTAPSAPTGVSATAGNGQVTISWNSVSGSTSYNIYWSATTGVTKTTGTKISNATSPYVHTSLTNGTTYYYVVTAVNSYGESSESSQISATPQATPVAADKWDEMVWDTGVWGD